MRGTAVGLAILVAAAVMSPTAAFAATAGVATPSATPAPASCHKLATPAVTAVAPVCWLDLAGFDDATARETTGQRLSFVTGDGYRLTFTAQVDGTRLRGVAVPALTTALFGNNADYLLPKGRPALEQMVQGGLTTLQLTDFAVESAAGRPVHNYRFVSADAESTDAGESLVWESSSRLSLIPSEPGNHPLGNACGGGTADANGFKISCLGATRTVGLKSGAAIVAANAPRSFSVAFHGGGLEGIALGIDTSHSGAGTTASASPKSTGVAAPVAQSSPFSTWPVWIGILAALALVALIILLARRRRRHDDDPQTPAT